MKSGKNMARRAQAGVGAQGAAPGLTGDAPEDALGRPAFQERGTRAATARTNPRTGRLLGPGGVGESGETEVARGAGRDAARGAWAAGADASATARTCAGETASAARLALRAAAAIFRRDWLIYWRYPMNAVFWLMQPFIWFTPVYFMGRSFIEDGRAAGFEAFTGTSDFMAFVLLGGIMSSYVSAVFWSIGMTLKNEMSTGVLESNWLAPVPKAVQLAGRTVFSLVSVTVESVVLMAVMWLLFRFNLGRDVVPAVLTALPMVIGIYGFGFAFAGLVLMMREANTMIDISSYLVNLLSGSTVPVVALPRFLMVIAMAIPLTYGYDAVRGILLGTRTLLPIHVEQAILVGFMGVMIALGLWAFSLVERRCCRLGTISMH